MSHLRKTNLATKPAHCIVVVLALAVACTPQPSPPDALTPGTGLPASPTSPAATSSTPTGRPAVTATPGETPSITPTHWLTDLPEVELARADLAQRLNVPPADIQVVVVQEVTWTDTSMGCPQAELGYLQVETDGLLIQLEYAGQGYNYHSGGSQPPFLCEQAFPT
jgi:hypothetical protein